MKNEITANRLSLALSNANMKPHELADKSGVSKSSISQYVNGSHAPSNISSGKMASILKVNALWLMGFDVPMSLEIKETKLNINTIPIESGYTIPVLGRVAAGYGKEAVEEVIDQIEISPALAAKGDYFGLLIKGDSMIPTLYDGDTVIVQRVDDAESGNLVIALVNGDDATYKRLQKYAEGIALIPQNPVYEPMRFTESEIDTTPVKILGRVAEMRRTF